MARKRRRKGGHALAEQSEAFNAYEIYNDRALARAVVDELGEGAPRVTGESDVGAFMGTSIVWTGDLMTYLDTTNNQVAQVQADVDRNRKSLPADFLDSWETYMAQWKKFYTEEKGAIHILDVATKMDQTDSYVERLKGYQVQMKTLGVARNVPGLVIDPMSLFAPKTQLTTGEKTAIGVGAALLLLGSVAIATRDRHERGYYVTG